MIGIALLAFALVLAGCDRPPSADSLPEWTPADHHSSDDDKLAAAPAQPTASNRPDGAPAGGADALVELTWRRQCSTCHGPSGKGDGPMAPMAHPPDLTLDAWQSTVSDAEIASVIRSGKGKMPSFDLPDPVLRGLVARVRATRGR